MQQSAQLFTLLTLSESLLTTSFKLDEITEKEGEKVLLVKLDTLSLHDWLQ